MDIIAINTPSPRVPDSKALKLCRPNLQLLTHLLTRVSLKIMTSYSKLKTGNDDLTSSYLPLMFLMFGK